MEPILNIETKENSPEKLAAIAGKETKFFLMAEEFNEVVDTVNALDNVRKEILISCPSTITALAFANLINELPSFEIGHNDFVAFKAVSSDAELITYYVELLNLGKGSYGIGGTVLTAENIKITSFGASSTDISELSTTQIVDLDYVGVDVVTALNSQLPNIVIQDQNDGYVIIKGIFAGGEFHEYLWLGVAGTYGGAGGLQSTESDFKELSSISGGYTKSEVDGLLLNKEDKANKTGTVIGNEASTSLFLHIAGMIAYFQEKVTFNQSRWQFSDFTNVSANQGPFIGVALASGTLGSSGVTSSGDLNSLGHVILNSSASANSGYRLLDAGGVAMCPKLGITFLGKFGLDSSAAGRDRITRMGFHSTQNQVAPVNGVYLEVLGNTASFKTTSGGITTSSSTVTLNDTFTGSSVVLYSVFITFTADRTARCVLYNSAMTALLTITFTTADNMPSLGSRFNSGIITTITTAGAIANICQVDYMGVGIAKPSFLNNY